MSSTVTCSMCYFVTDTSSKLTNHVVRYHRNDPHFVATCHFCSYVSNSYLAYKKHIQRCKNQQESTTILIDNEQYQDFMETDFQTFPEAQKSTFEYNLATFFLKLEAKHSLTQRCIDVIAEEVGALLNEVKSSIESDVKKACDKKGLSSADVDECLTNVIDLGNLTKKFDSAEKRKKYYVEHFNLLVPRPQFIYSEIKRVNGRVARINRNSYYVPFLDCLKNLLALPEVLYWATHPHLSQDALMRDWCDGEYCKKNQLQNHLHIILHIDDIETVNPIGMCKKVHKLTVVSFELGNIPPQFRSSVHIKQLLALCKTSYLKKSENGMKNLLMDFIEGINLLHDGTTFDINGKTYLFKGVLLATPADTPASNQLWGFKEGVAKAYKCCRTCEGVRPLIFDNFEEDSFIRRNTEQHLERLEILEEASTRSRISISKQYGINHRSPLFLIKDIDLCIAIHDPMHVLLQGVILVELKAMLHHYIYVDKFFTLEWINDGILSFDYSFQVTNKPPAFTAENLKSKGNITLTASAILILIYVLPFILAKKVPCTDDKLINFIRIIKITYICTSPYASIDIVPDLTSIIGRHHEVYKQEYPQKELTPKFHYLVHFPSQIRMFGPPRHHWCMRWEAHFSIFKGKKWGSFKNIAFSMANHHQLWSCYHQLGLMGERNANFLYSGHFIVNDVPSPTYSQAVNNDISLYFESNEGIWLTKEVIYHGCRYRPGVVISDETENMFYFVEALLAKEEKVLMLVKTSSKCLFVNHLNAYEVNFSEEITCRKIESFSKPFPLTITYAFDKHYIVNPYICKVHGT